MFNRITKDSIKVGLSVVITIIIAFSFGWDKAYWSVITICTLAATETYSHGIEKSRNRLLGTLLGSGYAFFLIATFAQDKVLFMLFYTFLLALCVFMASHKKLGYMFTMAFSVNVIIACSGGFNGDYSFNIAVLRIQETLLGVLVYSFIFRFVWPMHVEKTFYQLFNETIESLEKALGHLKKNVSTEAFPEQDRHIQKMYDILALPLRNSPTLAHQKDNWLVRINVIEQLQLLLNQKKLGKNISTSFIEKSLSTLSEHPLSPNEKYDSVNEWYQLVNTQHPIEEKTINQFTISLKERVKNAYKAVCIFITCLAMWIYIPIPGGYLMPLMGSIYANTLVTLPEKSVKIAAIGMLVCSVIFITQYVLLIPSLTEAWQLAGVYGFNVFLIWKICSTTQLTPLRIIGSNFMVILSMGALQLTPSYDIQSTLIVLPIFYLCLAITAFYNKVFRTDHPCS